MDTVESIMEGIDDNQHIPKVGGYNTTAVVSAVFRPDDLYLVIAKMPQLKTGTGVDHCPDTIHLQTLQKLYFSEIADFLNT